MAMQFEVQRLSRCLRVLAVSIVLAESLLLAGGCSSRASRDDRDDDALEHELNQFVATNDDGREPRRPAGQSGGEAANGGEEKPAEAEAGDLGKSFRGPLPPATAEQTAVAESLKAFVEHLAGDIGERNVPNHAKLIAAANAIDAELVAAGYQPQRQTFQCKGRAVDNIEVEIPGGKQASEIVIIGGTTIPTAAHPAPMTMARGSRHC